MPKTPSPLLRLATLVLLLVAPACKSPPVWNEVEFESSFDEIWGTFARIAGRGGYPMDIGRTDRGKREYVSRWREQALPMRMGARSRLHAEFERPDEAGDGWRIRFHVERQTIRDVGVGFDPKEDDWEDAGQEVLREQLLLGQLRVAFGRPVGIEPTFEQNR